MSEKAYSDKSIKLTAAVYATSEKVVEFVTEHGRLPDEIYS